MKEKTVIQDTSLKAGNLICNLPRVLTEHHFDKPYISNLKTTPERVHLLKHKNILMPTGVSVWRTALVICFPGGTHGGMVQLWYLFFPTGKGSCLVLETTSLDHGTCPRDLFEPVRQAR